MTTHIQQDSRASRSEQLDSVQGQPPTWLVVSGGLQLHAAPSAAGAAALTCVPAAAAELPPGQAQPGVATAPPPQLPPAADPAVRAALPATGGHSRRQRGDSCPLLPDITQPQVDPARGRCR